MYGIWWNNYDDMLSRFHLIPERYGQTDRQTDGQICYINICWRTIKTFSMIKRTFINRESKIILKLHQSLVRPKLEYCVQAWRPYLKKDIDLLEKVQNKNYTIDDKGQKLVIWGKVTKVGSYVTGDQKTTRRSNWSFLKRFLRVLIILNIHSFSLCQIPDLENTNKKKL